MGAGDRRMGNGRKGAGVVGTRTRCAMGAPQRTPCVQGGTVPQHGQRSTGAPAAGMWATSLSTATIAVAVSGEACGNGCSGPGGWTMGKLRAGGMQAGR